jgi:alkylation response protein AidB-like acyl-CoA dehydrogenase
MAKDIQGVGLGIASRFAGSEFAKKYGLRKPVEKLAYAGTKKGFEFIGQMVAKKSSKKSEDPKMLPAPSTHGLFDLTLSEEQQMIKDTVRSYAEEVVRGLAHDANEAMKLPETYLQDIMDLGLNFFSVPESLGGAAQTYSPTTSAIIAEELAWGDFSLAYATLAPVAVANAIVKWGTPAQKEKYLPTYLADTPVKAAITVQEPNALFNPAQLSTKAKKTKTGFKISGVKTLVPFGGEASMYLVAAKYKRRNRLFLVPGNAPGIDWKAAPAMGIRATATGTLTLDKVLIGKDAMLGDDSFNYEAFIDLGQLHWCSLAIGACEAALDYLIPYVNEREAFGEPISHRQAVAFMVANIGIELESMRMMTWRAAALAEAGKPFHREAFLAHLLCAEKAMEIGSNAVQLLGGHGFTKEHPAERWYRDLRILACVNGGMHL